MKRICVFCGSSSGVDPAFGQAALDTAAALAERGLGLVFGGGAVGLMGTVADGMLAAGGEAIGVIPRHLVDRELAHPGIEDLRVVGSMHERKALMAELSDGFIALPGGWGTLEEFVESLTWAQLGLHSKPLGVVNVGGYFDDIVAFQERAIASGFVQEGYRRLLLVAATPAGLLAQFETWDPPAAKWGEPPPP